MITYESKEARRDYHPPLLANGEIALQLDFMGTMEYDPAESGEDVSRVYASRFIWWEGRRYMYDMRRFLIPFGRLEMEAEQLEKRPQQWRQTLDTAGAKMQSACEYGDGSTMKTEAFVHHERNIVCIRRRFSLKKAQNIVFSCYLTDNKCDQPEKLPRYMNLEAAQDSLTAGWKLRYTVCGQKDYDGVLLFFADRPMTLTAEKNRFRLSFAAGADAEEELTLFYVLEDNQNQADYAIAAAAIAEEAIASGFDGLYQSHLEGWSRFYAESEVTLSASHLMDVYRAALYDMKAQTTRWSIPVGICDESWEGKYFAYDEYFSFSGLNSGGHRSLAKRVPVFRKAGLAWAVSRMSSGNLAEKEARYPWETVETGEEAAIPGFWYEHIFHMANISVGAWEYFAMTNDREFLAETAWPMLRACSEFYLRHMVYTTEGGKTVIGRVTDWERLGSSVINPYMTTCGVIRTLQITAESARILGIAEDFIREAEETAAALFKGLPDDGEKYVPHPACTQKSIGVYGGMYPYEVMEADNRLQRNAIEDYLQYEGAYGNMYAVGGGVSSWFAAWKALTYARIHEPERAWSSICQAAASSGCFGELFEINESKTSYRPWFTTANGIYLAAIHAMLLQSHRYFRGSRHIECEDTVYMDLLPGWPRDGGDVAFTLPIEGDARVTVRVRDNTLEAFSVEKGPSCETKKAVITCPAWLKGAPAELLEL